MINHKKTILSGLCFFLILGSLSYLINEVITYEAHSKVTFFRPDTPLKFIALFFTSMAWSMGNAYLHRLFAGKLKIESDIKRGALFGLIVLLFIVIPQDLFIFIFVDFRATLVVAELVHFTITYIVGHSVIALIQSKR